MDSADKREAYCLIADVHDTQFGINVLEHYHLTTLLMPVLLAAANASRHADVRVAMLTAAAYELPAHFDFAALCDCGKHRKNGTQSLCGQRKFERSLFDWELAWCYADLAVNADS